MKFILHDLSKNFRDIGGLLTYDGKRVKYGLLFRSALISKLSDEEINIINSLSINTIIDLRQPSSLLKKKDYPIRGAKIINIPLHESDNLIQFPKRIIDQAKNNDHGIAMEERTYRSIFYDNYSINQLRMIFDLIQNTDEPLLIHCALGKDRTGIVFFLLEHALGVREEEIINDYLLSNISTYCRISNKIQENINDYECDYQLIESSFELYLAKERYYKTSIDAIVERFGSISYFLSDILNVDLEKLKQKYLDCED